jgi:hypothetical protein
VIQVFGVEPAASGDCGALDDERVPEGDLVDDVKVDGAEDDFVVDQNRV